MIISKSFNEAYLSHLRSYLPSMISHAPDFESGARILLDDLVELATDEVCQLRKSKLNLSCEASALAERVLTLRDGREFIAGIRFKNLDTAVPFVSIQQSFELTSKLITEMSQIVKKEFQFFNPLGLKFKEGPNKYQELTRWNHVLYGKVSIKPLNEVPGVTFSIAKDQQWHEKYAEEYRARLEEKTELKGFIDVTTQESFAEALECGTLLIATDSEGLAGLVCGKDEPYYGVEAILITESFLTKRWVGKGIAPIMHQHLLNQLVTRYQNVWGTIYDKNLSSLGTAQRVGRVIIETEYFFEFK